MHGFFLNTSRIRHYIVVFLFIFCVLFFTLFKQIYAVSPRSTLTEDNSAYDFCFNEGYDSLKNAYKFRYRCYNTGGCWEGTFYIPSDIYNSSSNSYVVSIDKNGNLLLLQSAVNTDYFDVVYREASRNGPYDWFICYADSYYFYGKSFRYSIENDIFEFKNDFSSGGNLLFSPDNYSPDSILLTNTDVKYSRYDIFISSFK